MDIRHCINAADLEINDVVFQYRLDLLSPATEYEVIVRPFNLELRSGFDYSFIFGPSSLSVPFKAKDDVPEAAPVNLRSLSAREDQVDLTWEDNSALLSNGDIIEYEIHSINDKQNYTAEIRQISIIGLEPNTEYSYQVRARTSVGGFSNNYSSILTTRTCPQDMKRNDDVNCFAVQGSFAVSGNEALVCAVEVPNLVSDCETQEELTVQTLNILEGFWRPNINEFKEIKSCPVPEFCSKAKQGDNISAAILAEPESAQCASFHRGVYCSSCDKGYVLSNNDGCTKCADDIKSNHEANFISFVSFIAFLILLCVLYVVFKAVLGGSLADRCSDTRNKLNEKSTHIWELLGVKLRILEGFLQVMFAFQSVLYVDTNTNFLMESIGSIANLNLGLVAYAFEVYCAIDVNHYLSLLLYTLPPLCLAFMLFLLYLVMGNVRKDWRKSLKASSFEMFFIVSFLIYPGASKVILDTFFCEEFESVEEDSEFIFKTALRSDYRLSCSFAGSERIGWVAYATFMVLVYPVGILAIYLYFLYLFNKTEDKTLIKDLVYPYRDNRYWFEAYELVRKLLQTTFVSFCLLFGNQVASSVALNLSVFFLLVLVHLNPYRKYSDFGFAVMSLSMLAFATQLNSWFDGEECDRDCQAEKKGDAIGALVLVEITALFLFAFIEYMFSKNIMKAHEVNTSTVADEEEVDIPDAELIIVKLRTENKELNQKIDVLNEKIQGLNNDIQVMDNEMRGLNEKNEEQSNEITVLEAQFESLKYELIRYQQTFA